MSWIETKKSDMNTLFQESATRAWQNFVNNEIKTAKESSRIISSQRLSKFQAMGKRNDVENEFLTNFSQKLHSWLINLQNHEYARIDRFRQSLMAAEAFVSSEWTKYVYELNRERGLWGPQVDQKSRWKLGMLKNR